jgi:hypothetical protein
MKLPERYKGATFDRAMAVRNPQAEFFAIGHPFIDSMLRQIGDYGFGGHTTVRVVESPLVKEGEAKAGYQFNFTVRRRVQREDGDEYLFDFYTAVILEDGCGDKDLALSAAASYSSDRQHEGERALARLESFGVMAAYQVARSGLEREARFWDWDEDVDLIGVAKTVFLAPSLSR